MLVLIKILHWILFLIIYRYLHAITTIVITIISIIIIIVQIYWPGGGLSLPPPTTFLNVRTIIVNTIISIIISITLNTIVAASGQEEAFLSQGSVDDLASSTV